MHPLPRPSVRLAVLALCSTLAIVACGLATDPVAPVELGEPLTEIPGIHAYGSLFWAADDASVFFAGIPSDARSTGPALYRTNVRSGATEALPLDGDFHDQLVHVRGEDALIFRGSEEPCWYRYALETGTREVVTCNDQADRWFVSPDGAHLAYTVEPDVYLHDLTSGETRRLDRAALPLPTTCVDFCPVGHQIFSPNGRELLVTAWTGATWGEESSAGSYAFEVVALDTGQRTPLPVDLGSYASRDLKGVHWGSDGPRLLFSEWTDETPESHVVHVRDLVTGEMRTVWRNAAENQGETWSGSWSWSADGRALAFNVDACLRYGPWDPWIDDRPCRVTSYELKVHDLVTGGASTAARYDLDTLLTFALNGDATRIAYLDNNHDGGAAVRLYVAGFPGR